MTSTVRLNSALLRLTLILHVIITWQSLSSQQLPTYFIDKNTEVISLHDTLSYFIDLTGEKTKKEISTQAFTITDQIPILKSKEHFWFRFKVINKSTDTLEAYFCDRFQEIKSYYINDQLREFGDVLNGRQKTIDGCASIIFNPLEVKEFYIKHWNIVDARLATALELRNKFTFREYKKYADSNYVIMRRITLSILFFMTVLSLIFFITFRERFIGYYCLYIFGFFVFYSRNLISQELIPYNRIIEINLTFIIFSFYLLFIKHFFKTWKTNKTLDRLITIIVWSSLGFLLVSIGLQVSDRLLINYNIFNVYRLLMFIAIVYLMYLLLKNNKSRTVSIICFGNLFLLIPILSTFVCHMFNFTNGANVGYLFAQRITPSGFSYYMLHARIGVVLEIIFFSIAIALYLKQKASESDAIHKQHKQLSKVNQDIIQKKQLQQDQFTNELIEFINQNKELTIKIEHLSRHFGIGRTKLIQKIKDHTGQTPNQFIRFIKLSGAKEELITNSKSIKELADTYGFSSPAHFSQQFKGMFGQSPKTFQSEINDNQDD